jgi:hypothetical protein
MFQVDINTGILSNLTSVAPDCTPLRNSVMNGIATKKMRVCVDSSYAGQTLLSPNRLLIEANPMPNLSVSKLY